MESVSTRKMTVRLSCKTKIVTCYSKVLSDNTTCPLLQATYWLLHFQINLIFLSKLLALVSLTVTFKPNLMRNINYKQQRVSVSRLPQQTTYSSSSAQASSASA